MTTNPEPQRPPRWLRRIAEFGAQRGWPRYQVMLGGMLEREPPLNINLARANELYRRAAARGSSQAMWNLGVNYLGTKGGERDPKQAIHWLQSASGQGHGLATWALARLYLAGRLVEQDPAHGLELLQRSARGGCRPARQALVEVYQNGAPGIAPDPDKARHWARWRRSWSQRVLQRIKPS